VASGINRNLKQEFQFFETNPRLADCLIDVAKIHQPDLLVLEPSAGRGALVKAIRRLHATAKVDCFELQEVNRSFLEKVPGAVIIGGDFLKTKPKATYDRVIANPPFKNNQDIKHVFRMFCHLKKGGRLASIVSRHWQDNDGRHEEEFKKWLKLIPHQIIDLKPGEFKEAGTNVATSILMIDKS
jgi:hypothetical protein